MQTIPTELNKISSITGDHRFASQLQLNGVPGRASELSPPQHGLFALRLAHGLRLIDISDRLAGAPCVRICCRYFLCGGCIVPRSPSKTNGLPSM